MAGTMIRVRVPQLLKERNLTPIDLMYGARIAQGTAYKLANEEAIKLMGGISFDVLVKLCNFFGVGVEDILEISEEGKAVTD